jgi:hypothetical protein
MISRVSAAFAGILLVLVLQVLAIEALFFPPQPPFPLDNDVAIVWNPKDESALSTARYQGTRLGARDAEQAIAALHASMRQYPQWILDEHLDEIVLVRSLTHENGRTVGGLASGGTIFLTARSACRGDFHHELAHVLHRVYGDRVDEQEWQLINPPGFRYVGRNGTPSGRGGERRSAFVSDYAMTNVGEDVAETAAELFREGYGRIRDGARGDRVKHKASILMEFYRSIDPVFTEQFFRNLS